MYIVHINIREVYQIVRNRLGLIWATSWYMQRDMLCKVITANSSYIRVLLALVVEDNNINLLIVNRLIVVVVGTVFCFMKRMYHKSFHGAKDLKE